MAQSLDRGLRILDEIAAGRTTLGEISTSLGVHKSTVLRLLATLQQHHFVYREDVSHYRLGRRLFDLAAFALDSRQVVAHARGAMRRLGGAIGHATYLATVEGSEVVVVDVGVGGSHHPVVRVGEALPPHATAAGKVLLGGMPPAERDDVLARISLTAETERTVTDPDAVRDELAKVATIGFALELGEFRPHVNAVAAPVRDSSGRVVAALAVTVPSVSFAEDALTQFVPELLASAGDVSRELGWG